MGKLRLDLTNQKTLKRLERERDGTRNGADYVPFLKIRDVPSIGISTQHPTWKVENRMIHLLSNLELYLFYMLEWDPEVVDYKEQYALDMRLTQRIAEQEEIPHPKAVTRPKRGVKASRVPIPMTTDIVAILSSGKRRAYSVKPLSALDGKGSMRVKQKLRIEELYWDSCGVPWQLITEKELNMTLARNVELVHPYRSLSGFSMLDEAVVSRVNSWLYPRVASGLDGLSSLADQCDRELGLKEGTSLTVAKHLVASQQWPVDFSVPFNPCRPVRLLTEQKAA